jgi:hypothetical protein
VDQPERPPRAVDRLVRVVQAIASLPRQLADHHQRDAQVVPGREADHAGQREPLHVLHDQEVALAVGVEVLNLDEVLVLHRSAQAGLVDEQLAERGAGGVVGQDDLDRHLRVNAGQRLPPTLVDEGHSALGEGPHDAVLPQPLGDVRRQLGPLLCHHDSGDASLSRGSWPANTLADKP